jgi:hypothetical protein
MRGRAITTSSSCWLPPIEIATITHCLDVNLFRIYMGSVIVRASVVILVLAGPLATKAGDSFPGIRHLMGEKTFRAAGLERLSPQELEALDAWLLEYTGVEAPRLRAQNSEVREAEREYVINARLSSDFEGWDGETLFPLDNGQIWRQRLSGRYSYDGEPAPEVQIRKNWLGFYMMTVIDSGRTVGVTRVR